MSKIPATLFVINNSNSTKTIGSFLVECRELMVATINLKIERVDSHNVLKTAQKLGVNELPVLVINSHKITGANNIIKTISRLIFKQEEENLSFEDMLYNEASSFAKEFKKNGSNGSDEPMEKEDFTSNIRTYEKKKEELKNIKVGNHKPEQLMKIAEENFYNTDLNVDITDEEIDIENWMNELQRNRN